MPFIVQCPFILAYNTTSFFLTLGTRDSHWTRQTLFENPFLISVSKYDLVLSLKQVPGVAKPSTSLAAG